MDIAEIRKKSKSGSGKSAKKPKDHAPTAPVSASVADVPTAVDADGAANLPMYRPVAVSSSDLVEPSPLDRLFAVTDGMQLADEEFYQTTLASQSDRHEEATRQFLAFQLGNEEYALDISQISEIIKPRDYTDIPRVPEFIVGLVSLRGVVVPIFDLRRRFQMGAVERSLAARIIVCQDNGVAAGLLVDKINQVVKIATDRIEPPPAVITGVERHLISGIGRYQGRMIIMLNLASVLEIAPG